MTARIGSPSSRSIFTTSAPQPRSAAAPDGTKPCSEKSTTLIPASGSVMNNSWMLASDRRGQRMCRRHLARQGRLRMPWEQHRAARGLVEVEVVYEVAED